MKGERERVGGWTIKTEKLCVYKQQQKNKQTNKNKRINKQTKNYWAKYRNTETYRFFVFHQSSISISSWTEINITLFGIL